MNRNGYNMQPTPEVMVKKDVMLVTVLMQQLELLYSAWKMVIYHCGMP